MSIFDVFSFKRKLEEVVTTENFLLVRNTIKEGIVAQAKETSLTGLEKMNNVVDKVIALIKEKINSDNKYVQWLIDNVLIKNIRLVAQSIYDDLKAIIQDL